MTRFLLTLALAALVASVPLAAGAAPDNAFTLSNTADVPLHFLYSCKGDATLTSAVLAGGATKSYWYNNGCETYTIKKSTTSGAAETTFTYTLYAGQRYKIGWDAAKNAWNIFLNDNPPENAFSLTNTASRPLHFSYGCKGQSALTSVLLDANTTKNFWYNNGCDTYTIQKSTTSGAAETTFTYTLHAGHRYNIGWDASKNAWNIFEQQ
jgi:hypothetical protein